MSVISDKDFYHLTISINKALNPIEAPLKIKHARSIIIMTHRTKEAKSFWTAVTRQPLMEHRFTAWKFCHLLHKVLREGHINTHKHSITHKKMIIEMGKLWGHLQDGVGSCIQAYSKLIVTKLEFHQKNEIFPGTLLLDFQEIQKFAGNDINVYFQLCVEIFDYLDEIIQLESNIFIAVNTYRMSSMTPQGQCRLAPLITLIQDSNPLYDLCVRVMFKLHDELPNDILGGHRDRFKGLFTKLKLFYDNVRPLQYFADLIQVPNLPDTAPNFTSKIDFGSYIPPVVYVQPEPEPEPPMENLVDTCVTMESNESIALKTAIQEKDCTIQGIQNELLNLKRNSHLLEANYQRELNDLRQEINILSNELASAKEMCGDMRLQKEYLEQRLEEAPILLRKATEEEEKAKTSEDKFTKLKIMYTQMRDEHINLLRQQGEGRKQLNKEKNLNSELQSEILNLKSYLTTLEEKVRLHHELQDEKEKLEIKIQEVINENELRDTNEKTVSSELHSQIEKLNDHVNVLEAEVKLKEGLIAEKQKLELKVSEIMQQNEVLSKNHEDLKSDLEERNASKSAEILHLKNNITEVSALLNKAQNEICQNKEVHEKTVQLCMSDLEKKKMEVEEMKRSHAMEIAVRCTQIHELQVNLNAAEKTLKEQQLNFDTLTEDKNALEKKLELVVTQKSQLENKLQSSLVEIASITSIGRENEKRYQNIVSSLLETILKSMEQLLATKCNEPNEQSFEKTMRCLNEMENIVNKIHGVYDKYCKENVPDDLSQSTVFLGYYFVMLHEQCLLINNTTSDIPRGQAILSQVNRVCEPLVRLYRLFSHHNKADDVEICIAEIKSDLAALSNLIINLQEALSQKIDFENLIQSELADMDKAIEEAAATFVQLLSEARLKDTGVSLEVNEKILDSCTTLMECIKLLIKKSKTLQEEIISTGRGSTSVKDFYKRNSQWTEGLLSASKSVAKGANLLVEAANKAVSSTSHTNFEIIVAAQEIAACTAQLVIASKVKAPKESQKLFDLTKASRNVSQATGALVATVKDCNQQLEQLQEVDVSKLTSSQAKTMEMEMHVKVLELEHALQSERLKLSSFRRNHYQNAED